MNSEKKSEFRYVKLGGFRRFIGDLTDKTKTFLLFNQYLTLISHHAKGDSRNALMKAADLKYRQKFNGMPSQTNNMLSIFL